MSGTGSGSGGVTPVNCGRHIAIDTWLDALGLRDYLPLFSAYGGVEDLLYASEAEVRELGLKNAAHRAKVVSSLRILRQKYEKGKTTGSGVFSLQQTRPPTSPTEAGPAVPLPPHVIASPEKLAQDLQKELNADPSELKSRAWYHGSISRQHAEALVKEPGDFLVRDSSSKPGDFVLTCWWRGASLHFMVNALVGECAPGSLPTIHYQFEEEAFGSIQELIQFYLARQKPVTLVSGAVLKTPVSRTCPLSYYDCKYGSLQGSGGYYSFSGGRRTKSNSSSPLSGSPTSSPSSSPGMKRRGPKRTGSQPVLNVDDSELLPDPSYPNHHHHHHHLRSSRSPSPLERFGSLPVINVIPPGGPGYVSTQSVDESSGSPEGAHPHHQRSGSAPTLNNDEDQQGRDGFFSSGRSSPSMRMAPAVSESNLSRAPPPKPSRVPSIKYKHKPVVVVRKPELYLDDDGRDYTDVDQLSGPPSWACGGDGGGGGGYPPSPSLPITPRVSKSHSFQLGGSGGGGGGGESEIYDNNFNAVHNKGYQTLPHKSSTKTKKPLQRQAHEDKPADSSQHIIQTHLAQSSRSPDRQITMPGFNLGSRIRLDAFNDSSSIFPSAAENRLLEPAAVMKVKSVLLGTQARAIAAHVTKGDLQVLRVAQEDDFGVGVTSGIELCTLPQGDQLREDIIERCHCQRLFVVTSLLTCNAVTERARMLSQWIQTAGELKNRYGNLYAFTSVMEGITSPQVQRLRDTWMILRQSHTSAAFLFDTRLKSLLKSLHEGSGILPLQNVTLPNLSPVVELLQRDPDDLETLLSWEKDDPNSGLDFLLAHLDVARIIASQTRAYRAAAKAVLERDEKEGVLGEEGFKDLEEVCRTEFQLRFLYGSKGARASRPERLRKFEQLLMVLSERLEPPGDDGTAV